MAKETPNLDGENGSEVPHILPPVKNSLELCKAAMAVLEDAIETGDVSIDAAYRHLMDLDTVQHLQKSDVPIALKITELFELYPDSEVSHGEAFSLFKTALLHRYEKEIGNSVVGKIRKILSS